DIPERDRRRGRRGRHIGGLVLAIIGLFLLLQNLDLGVPGWVFSWPSLLILIGILVGVRQNFRSIGWLAMICVGSVFLFHEIAPDFLAIRQELIWPIVLIIVGVLIYLRNAFGPDDAGCDPRDPWRYRWGKGFRPPAPPVPPYSPLDDTYRKEAHFHPHHYMHQETTDNDYVNASAIFSGTQKTVLSKNFQGGNLSAMFGGLEVNLMQADFTGTAVLTVNVFCGGTEIVVPGNWTVRLEETTLFGGTEDSRPPSLLSPDPSKVLIIRGSCLFGGLEVKSY
ncbi:MAG TPA: LiaF domain-containing protein, partial [Chitinophaga sp.]